MKKKTTTTYIQCRRRRIYRWVAAAVQLTFTAFDCDNGDDDEDDTRNT